MPGFRSLIILMAMLTMAFTNVACTTVRPVGETQEEGSLSSGDAKAIESLRALFVQALTDGGRDTGAPFFTEDGAWMNPGEPVLHGRSDIQTWLQGLQELPPLKSLILTPVKSHGRNGLAYDRGAISYAYEDIMSGEMREDTGDYLMVFRRHADDSWLIAEFVHNSVQADQQPEPATQVDAGECPCFEASAWREADQMFYSDPHWVGADVASSVDLGGGRILWLFGDSWIDPTGKRSRENARMVSNTVAIQTGADPSTAEISFCWGMDADGGPDAMFPGQGALSLWFGNGVLVDDRLILFFSPTLRHTGTDIMGFEHVGWTAVMVENPDSEPSIWKSRALETPTNPLGILVGFASVLRLEEHVYALGPPDPIKSAPIYAARWPAEEVRRGNLLNPEWWGGDRMGWVSDSSGSPRWPILENGSPGLTIHFDQVSQSFLAVQTHGFGPADVLVRAAARLTGPWSAARMVYRPPEYYRPDILINLAKAHPYLTGGDLILTYSTNTFRFQEHLTDSLIYYPRFVKLTRCR